MPDRRLKGSRLGATSYATGRNQTPAPHQVARYRTADGDEFDVIFADDAVVPGAWVCRNGKDGSLIDGEAAEPAKGRRIRTSWDMLLERRSIEDLRILLAERLEAARAARGET